MGAEPLDRTKMSLNQSRTHYQMKTCFERSAFKSGQSFFFRITHFYDPSKFWITTRYRELEAFQKYLWGFYYVHNSELSILRKNLAKDIYCVVFSEGSYYRGVIVGFTCSSANQEAAEVFLLDYGSVKLVHFNFIYYMDGTITKVPQFSIRSSLAGVCPASGGQWTIADSQDFLKLVGGKILYGLAINIDTDRKLVDVHISEKTNGVITLPFHLDFIRQGRWRYIHDKGIVEASNFYNVEHPYLFPSHEALESGKVPINVIDANYQKVVARHGEVVERYYNSNII